MECSGVDCTSKLAREHGLVNIASLGDGCGLYLGKEKTLLKGFFSKSPIQKHTPKSILSSTDRLVLVPVKCLLISRAGG